MPTGSFASLNAASYVPNCVIIHHAHELDAGIDYYDDDDGDDADYYYDQRHGAPRPSGDSLSSSDQPRPMTLVIVDVSGFTKISGWLQRHKGAEGPELMSGFLSEYFGRILDCVAFYGGDVLKFAGDALICIWPAEPALAVRRACVCAAMVVRLLHNYKLPGQVPHTLSLHAAVHVGHVRSCVRPAGRG